MKPRAALAHLHIIQPSNNRRLEERRSKQPKQHQGEKRRRAIGSQKLSAAPSLYADIQIITKLRKSRKWMILTVFMCVHVIIKSLFLQLTGKLFCLLKPLHTLLDGPACGNNAGT